MKLFAEREESIFVTSDTLYNLLRINTLYRLFYVVSIIYSNNYIFLSTAKIDVFFYFTKHFSNFFHISHY